MRQASVDGGQPSSAWRRVETLGIAQIVVLILEARKTMPWATAATVSRERHGDGTDFRAATPDSRRNRGAYLRFVCFGGRRA
jgi:hypothetical protein